MRYDKIRLRGPFVVDLPIVGATPDGPFVLRGAEGLGAPDVDVFITRTRAGSKYGGRSAQNRELTLTVGLQPNWSEGENVSDLRDILYGLLSPMYGTMVLIQLLENDEVVAFTEGQVRRMPPQIFTSDPTVQIEIGCFSPYLEGSTQYSEAPEFTVNGGFSEFTVLNTGTAPSPIIASFVFVDGHTPGNTLMFTDAMPTGERMLINKAFDAGDILIINTTPGQRGVWKLNESISAVPEPILSFLDPQSDWLNLHFGENLLRINNTNVQWAEPFEFNYSPRYWGV